MMKLEINAEMVENIIVASLRETYEGIWAEIQDLIDKDDLMPHQEQDLLDCRRNLAAVRTVLAYYTPHSEHQEYMARFYNLVRDDEAEDYRNAYDE
jgi:hypothetical protein